MTLLVGDFQYTWRDLLKSHAGTTIVLDPADANYGFPGRVTLIRDGKVVDWVFVGSTDVARNPLAILAACGKFRPNFTEESQVLLFPYRASPVLHQLALRVAQALPLTRIKVPTGSGLEKISWPLGAEEIELPAAFPNMVLQAQRRARWLELIEQSSDHTIDLTQVGIEGSRLGSGNKLEIEGWNGWAEVSGDTLLLVGTEDPPEEKISRFMDFAHTRKVSIQDQQKYRGLICAFASQEGEDFGMGVVQSFDASSGKMEIKCTAVSPAPVRLLRLGSLRIDESGKELPGLPAWSL